MFPQTMSVLGGSKSMAPAQISASLSCLASSVLYEMLSRLTSLHGGSTHSAGGRGTKVGEMNAAQRNMQEQMDG
jgi:hypothetical protein